MPAITPSLSGLPDQPTQNKIGAKAPTIGGNNKPRPIDTHQQMVTVFDKEGNPHEYQRHQANDLVNHVGWTWGNPKKPKEDAKKVAGEEPKAVEGSAEASAATPKEPDELDVLRAQLKEKGVEVDNRWGKKRLQEELEKVTT